MTDESESATEANAIRLHGNRTRKIYQFGAVLIAVAMISSGLTLVAIGDGPSGFSTVLEPGSLVTESSYIIFRDSGICFAKNGTTGAIEFSDSNTTTVFDSVLNAINGAGGLVTVRAGSYVIWHTLVLNNGTTIQGECQADDSGIVTYFDCSYFTDELFYIAGFRVSIKDVHLYGGFTNGPWFIDFAFARRYVEIDNVVLDRGAGGGINLNGAYWVELDGIRGIQLSDYIVKNNAGTPVWQRITRVYGYECDGLVYLVGGVSSILQEIGCDYFVGMTKPLVYIQSAHALALSGFSVEGDPTVGIPVASLHLSGSIVALTASRFYQAGEAADPYSINQPIRLTDGSRLTLSGVRFSLTKSAYDIAVGADCFLDANNATVVWSKGPSKFCTNRGTEYIVGSTSITFDHDLTISPVLVLASFNTTAMGAWGWVATTTNITISVENSGTYTVYWYAQVF